MKRGKYYIYSGRCLLHIINRSKVLLIGFHWLPGVFLYVSDWLIQFTAKKNNKWIVTSIHNGNKALKADKSSTQIMINKNEFQWDAYRPLVARTFQHVCSQGGVCSGGVCSRGMSAPGGACLLSRGVSQHAMRQTPSPVNRMTDRCKNITLPQTSFAGGNYWSMNWDQFEDRVCYLWLGGLYGNILVSYTKGSNLTQISLLNLMNWI